MDHLWEHLFCTVLYKKFGGKTDDVVVVSPDVGGVGRSRKFAEKLDVPLAIIDKRRPKANVCEIMNIIGDVKGKRAILVDDLIDTAGTVVNAANAMGIWGQGKYACCTHGVLSGPAIDRIRTSAIKELVTLNTIPLPAEKRISKITTLSVGDVFAEAIEEFTEYIDLNTILQQ